ncbi:MAG: prohibitin family protein [Chloroflexi bacterium]|nr:prohibitin family protein [Chloroflexota bacterium]
MNFITLIGAVAAFSWLGVIALIGLLVARTARRQTVGGAVTYVIIAVVVALALNVVSAGLVFIEPTERGVVVSGVPGNEGVRSEALTPGLNWIVPFLDRVVTYPISRQTYTMSIAPSEGQIIGDDSVEARTSDGQVVFVDASVIFALNPTTIVDVHIDWQNQYLDGLVRPLSRGIIRDAVSLFGVEEVYSTERITVTDNITVELESKLAEEGLILVDFVLRNIAFSPEYAASVEQKQVAEQQAQQAVFVVEQRKQEAEQARQAAQGVADAVVISAEGEAQRILIEARADAEARLIQAEAEAQALALLAAAIAENPDVLTLEYIDKLAPGIQVMLLPSDNPFLLPLPDINSGTPSIP